MRPPWQRLARLNRRVTNPIMERVGSHVAPWAVIIHQGRRSGRTYRTPVVAFVGGGSVTVALPYGRDSDWVKNLIAAGGGSLVRRGRRYTLVRPHLDGRTSSPGAWVARRVAGHVLTADLEEEE
jgi:deazaflavin-dependent oxidoreductase (nitroreductase family)